MAWVLDIKKGDNSPLIVDRLSKKNKFLRTEILSKSQIEIKLASKSDFNFPIKRASLGNSLVWLGFEESGRQDSNLRPSAPKAPVGNTK